MAILTNYGRTRAIVFLGLASAVSGLACTTLLGVTDRQIRLAAIVNDVPKTPFGARLDDGPKFQPPICLPLIHDASAGQRHGSDVTLRKR